MSIPTAGELRKMNGRKQAIWIGEETTSGTKVAVSYWIEKTKRKDYTYETQYVRSDWVIFTEDTIDWVRIEDLQEKEKEHIQVARRIRWLLNSHKAKF